MKNFAAYRVATALLLSIFIPTLIYAQSGRNRQTSTSKRNQTNQEQTTDKSATDEKKENSINNKENSEPVQVSNDDVVKVDTNLVLVPVIVSDRSNIYKADLKKEDFEIYEDEVKQDVAFFGTTTQPFNVVLMLDTSGSTQEKLPLIQQAAHSFVEQLQKNDRVKVISFDDSIRELSEFTSDRIELRNAIYRTRPGNGTRLYDAMDIAINSLQKIEGRKAIVIFTDGVDYHSTSLSYENNIERLEESGIIVYPIRYDTREEVARIMRGQPTISLKDILGGGTPTGTATTFPGGSGNPTQKIPPPTGGNLPTITITPPTTTTNPRRNDPTQRYPRDDDPLDPNSRKNDPTYPQPFPRDSVEAELNMLYSTADAYLKDLSTKTGGTLNRADRLTDLPAAFEKIANELRTQYSLGYYPLNKNKDGKYRKLKVKTTRKNVSVRAKPGYRVPKEN